MMNKTKSKINAPMPCVADGCNRPGTQFVSLFSRSYHAHRNWLCDAHALELKEKQAVEFKRRMGKAGASVK